MCGETNNKTTQAYYYVSLTEFEHFWHGDFYFVIQDRDINLSVYKPYAKLYSENYHQARELRDYVKDKNLISEVSFDFMKSKLDRAIEIIHQSIK